MTDSVTRYGLAVLLITSGGCQETPTRPTRTPSPPPQLTASIPPPMPRMRVEDAPLTVTHDPAGFRLHGRLENVGDTCGTQIGGQLYFSTAAPFQNTSERPAHLPHPHIDQTLPITADPHVIVRPGEFIGYEACCLPLSVAGQEIRFDGLLRAEPIDCP